LIGTPAYMAPEQYRGAPPDPRTDQFAFCVTAWQALTGERPFKGATLDEMRRSAGAGVEHVEAKLPRGVRGVLARGLDPDANQRWPAMDELLDALERVAKAPARRRLLWSYGLAGLLLVVALVYKFGFSDDARAKAACDDPDSQFREAWSPALRTELARKTSPANVARIGEGLDRYAERWVESYAKACRARKEKPSRQRIACLEGIRDRVSAITGILSEAPPHVLDVFDPRDANPPVASCETASPLAPPRVPADQPRRGKILKLIGKAFALRGTPPDKLGGATDALLAEVRPLAWSPLDSLVLVAAANEYLRAGQLALARETFNRAIASLPKQAALRDVRIEGSAYLGLLETSLRELENPRAALPPGIADPKAQVPLHGELAVRITKATNAANGDPTLLASRSLLAAIAYAHAAQWNRYESGYEEALQLTVEARKQFEAIGDVQRAATATSIEAWIYLLRGDERALDDALFAARRAQDALEGAKLPRNPSLDQVRATVAFARREYKELYRILSAAGPMEPRRASSQLVKGRVVGEKAEQAVVVAWQGDLVGHAANIAMNPREMTGSVVKVESDGSFEIQAGPDWAIMAESKNVRSTPRRIGMGALTLQLEPTVTLSGQLEGGSSFGVKAFARYEVGDNRWTLQTPIDKDGAFDLRGLPPGARSYGTHGSAGTGERTVVAGSDPKAMRWSSGSAIEAIVRAKEFSDGARAWVLLGTHAVKTRDELDAVVKTLTDVATSGLGPVGADNTDAGRDIYRAGDRHAVITGNYDQQDYTVCVTTSAAGPFACKRVVVEKSVSIDYQDGRHGAGVTPILFEL
jgi:tetratricopeptide (TPR) repeat protein